MFYSKKDNLFIFLAILGNDSKEQFLGALRQQQLSQLISYISVNSRPEHDPTVEETA